VKIYNFLYIKHKERRYKFMANYNSRNNNKHNFARLPKEEVRRLASLGGKNKRKDKKKIR